MFGSMVITPAQLAPEDTPRLQDNAQRRRRRGKDHPAPDDDGVYLSDASQEQPMTAEGQQFDDSRTIRLDAGRILAPRSSSLLDSPNSTWSARILPDWCPPPSFR